MACRFFNNNGYHIYIVIFYFSQNGHYVNIASTLFPHIPSNNQSPDLISRPLKVAQKHFDHLPDIWMKKLLLLLFLSTSSEAQLYLPHLILYYNHTINANSWRNTQPGDLPIYYIRTYVRIIYFTYLFRCEKYILNINMFKIYFMFYTICILIFINYYCLILPILYVMQLVSIPISSALVLYITILNIYLKFNFYLGR